MRVRESARLRTLVAHVEGISEVVVAGLRDGGLGRRLLGGGESEVFLIFVIIAYYVRSNI